MIKVFYDQIQEDTPYIYLLYPNLKVQHKVGGALWNDKIFSFFIEPAVEVVSHVGEADFILLPHNYDKVKNNVAFLNYYRQLSLKTGKRLVVFAYGDQNQAITIPDAIIFTYELYSSCGNKNKIKMPPLCEDLALLTNLYWREKKNDKPSLGFCGRAGFASLTEKLKIKLQSLLLNVKKGIYYREKIVGFLSRATMIEPKFIIRHSYSANRKTIELSPEQARKEFIDNLNNSDFSLDIRGDSNESTRFYESLSLGRVPVVIDTARVFPFEKVINYEEFILRIPAPRYKETAGLVADFYNKLSGEEFIAKQKRAREVFEKYLRIDSYFKYVFASPERLISLLD